MGNLTLPWWGGKFEPKSVKFKFFFFGQTHGLFQSMEQFNGEYIAFVSKWLTEERLKKLSSVLEGIYE